MSKEKKICLAAIRREMQTQYQYESREKRNKIFETLYYGWRQQEKRRGRHSAYLTEIWKRGWVSQKDAEKLREYIGVT